MGDLKNKLSGLPEVATQKDVSDYFARFGIVKRIKFFCNDTCIVKFHHRLSAQQCTQRPHCLHNVELTVTHASRSADE